MLPTLPLPPASPSNLIRKGRATSTGYPHHLLGNLLFSHLALPGHNIINYMHHISDDRQCVRHLPSMPLLYDLLHVRRPGRRSFIRWENTRVRLWHTNPCSQAHNAMVSHTHLPKQCRTTPERFAA